MKKSFLILAVFSLFILSACGSSTDKCQFTKMVETTYNLNKGAASFITTQDTTLGCYSVTKNDHEVDLKDKKSNFRIIMKTNPNIFDITKGRENYVWKENHGYKIKNNKRGDTLVFSYFPTKETSENLIKVGVEYKFYN